MASVKFKGDSVQLNGEPPNEGQAAPDFKFVKADLQESKLSDFSDKYKVIMAVPSLDTGVCQTQTKVFNEKLSEKQTVVGIVVSLDLPFAMGRFCDSEGIKNVLNASDFRYHDFVNGYKLEMTEGPLKGLSARAVFILDQENQIVYKELVPEITQEPDYEKALAALKQVTE